MKTLINYHLKEKINIPYLMQIFPSEFTRFIDPFCGSASVWTHGSFSNAVLSDLNPRFIDVFKAVKEDCDGLIKALDTHKEKYNWKYFGTIKKKPGMGDCIQRASNWIYLNKCSHLEYFRFNKAGLFLGAWGDNQFCPELYDIHTLYQVKAKLLSVSLNAGDFESIIDASIKGDFVYCHPPIRLERVNYKQDFSEDDYLRLKVSLKKASQRGVKFLVLVDNCFWVNNIFKEFKLWQLKPGEHAYINYEKP